jgi:hypothetical protein
MEEKLKERLKSAVTMQEIFTVCASLYDLNLPLGVASQIVVKQGIKSVLKIIKAPERKY